MKNLKHFLLAPMMIVAGAFAFMACSNNDNGSVAPELSPAEIQKQWICDYAEEGVDPLMDEPYNRTVMAYEFFADGTGYFEFYTLYDDHLVRATATRNFDGDFTYTISGNTITIQFNGEGEGGWDLKYANGRLRDIFPNTYVPSTPEQQAELLKWCHASGNFCNRSPERAHNRKLVLGHTPGASFFCLEVWRNVFFSLSLQPKGTEMMV